MTVDMPLKKKENETTIHPCGMYEDKAIIINWHFFLKFLYQNFSFYIRFLF